MKDPRKRTEAEIEIEKKVEEIRGEMAKVSAAKEKRGTSLAEIRKFEAEWHRLNGQLEGLQKTCSHRLRDKTAGGAILCSICDDFLEMQ